MSDKTTITVKIDKKTKESATLVFKEYGYSLTTGIRLFLEEIVKTKEIPFVIGKERLNDKILETIKKTEKDINVYGPYSSLEEFKKSLDD